MFDVYISLTLFPFRVSIILQSEEGVSDGKAKKIKTGFKKGNTVKISLY